MIVFDLQPTQSVGSGHRGIGRYTRELAAAIARRHPDLVDAWCWDPAEPVDARLFEAVPRRRLVPIDQLDTRSIDLFHITSPFEERTLGSMLPGAPIINLVATCYDLIPLRFPDRYLLPSNRATYTTRAALLHQCSAIVTDSASAAADCVDLLDIPPDRLTVIGGGTVATACLPRDSSEDRLSALRHVVPAIRSGYVMVPSGMDWRKNTEGAIAAFAELPHDVQRRHQLVIASNTTQAGRQRIEQLVTESGAVGEVLISGYVADDDLVRLYQTAELVLFPSFYEGFGLPVLEARRCGAPVICSDGSSLPEVMPLASARFNPWSVDEMARTLEKALTDGAFRAELLAAPDPGFTFELAADKTAEVYEAVLTAAHKRRARRRPRLALAGALPPEPGALPNLDAALARELSRAAEVTCFVADNVVGAATPGAPWAVRSLDLLGPLVGGGAFDAVVYVLGDSAADRPYIDCLDNVPGVVVLRELSLARCYTPEERQRMVERHYAAAGGRVRYLAEVARRARACLVESSSGVDAVQSDTGVPASNVGAPFEFDPFAAGDRADREKEHGSGVRIVTIGAAGVAQQTDVFVDAAEAVLAQRPEWSAWLVGTGGERFAGADSPVNSVGQVDPAGLERWIDRATVLVQLQNPADPELSVVITKAIGRGVPTIACDHGVVADLPPGSVVKVARTIGPEELATLIISVGDSAERRADLSGAAIAHAARNHVALQAERILAAALVTE